MSTFKNNICANLSDESYCDFARKRRELFVLDLKMRESYSPNIVEIAEKFFETIKSEHLQLCEVARAINLKQTAELLGGIRLEKYMSEKEQHEFFVMGEFFREQLNLLRTRAEKKGIARGGNVIEDACHLQKFEGRQMLIISASDIVMEGKLSLEIDKKHWVHHMFKIGSTSFPMMETKCLALSNLEPVYFNEFLFDLPPKTAFIKKYGEQAEFALWQEADQSERSRRF